MKLDGQEIVFIGCEDKKVRLYTFEKNDSENDEDPPTKLVCFAALVGHDNRVKAINIIKVLGQDLATTISSDGKIRVFPLSGLTSPDPDSFQKIEPMQTFDTKGSRLTCLTVVAVRNDRTTRGTAEVGDSDDSGDDDSDSEEDEDSDIGLQGEVKLAELDEEEVNVAEQDDSEDDKVDDEEAENEGEEAEWGRIDD